MSFLLMSETTAPSVPASGKEILYFDVADEKTKVLDDQGFTSILTPDGWRDQNLCINGDFGFAQRQVPTTLTSNAILAGGRTYAFDRFFQSNLGTTAVVQTQQVSNLGGAEIGVQSEAYGKFKVITLASKLVVGQVIESGNMNHTLGLKVRFSCKMKYSVAASMPVRLGMAYMTGAGTADTISRAASGFISAFGAAGVDPTFTAAANLAYITPNLAENGTITGSAVDITLTNAWVRYSATFTIPATARNLIPMVWSNTTLVVNDELNITEWGVYVGEESRDWHPKHQALELLDCDRYYNKTFPLLIAPAQNAGLIGAANGICSLAAATALAGRVWWYPGVNLRRVPVAADITLYNPSAANALMRNPYIAVPADMGVTALTANLAGSQIEVAATGSATTLVGSVCTIHIAVDVDI
jgi:hypothetical protein